MVPQRIGLRPFAAAANQEKEVHCGKIEGLMGKGPQRVSLVAPLGVPEAIPWV